jgi:Reverse transcriptase (RNA-dependent DNA polymerase)
LFKIDFKKTFDRVNWQFLFEIINDMGFSDLWIGWIKAILYGSITCVNVNGQLSEYFSCQRGMRQGDPLSPFLFDLVANGFYIILHKAQQSGFIKGLGQFGSLRQILNLYFANNTLLYLEAIQENIQALKWLLLRYEDLSGMKINFHKCELVTLNIVEENSQ